MFAGLVVGVLLGPSAGLVEVRTGILIGNWLALPGQLFLAVIQMIVVPLVVASVIRGLAASDNLEQLRQLGLVVTTFFIVTTAFAALLGLWIAGLLGPGEGLTGTSKRRPKSARRRTQHRLSRAWRTCLTRWWDYCRAIP